ncbi:MAG TPA: hypothetical protein VNY34_02575 [Solirubrobacteraceae bacterium]|jgi:hypothetical protein|nr:hypothetical protein [Solirubrobacteraceae bacterium]
MTPDAWPSPDALPGPLPRIEDLPIAEQGYDQEAVREAFDSFYRHAAQLDASLRALETVEVFRRDADALRNDLRALRALGIGGLQERPWTVDRYDVPRREIPAAVFRLAAESVLIVSVAVIAGISHLRPAAIVALMATAFVIVAVSEWLAARARFVPPVTAFMPSAAEGEPAPYIEAPAPERHRAPEPDEDTEPEALTIVGVLADQVEAAAALDPWEHGPEANGAVPDPEAEPELAERGGRFRRRRR